MDDILIYGVEISGGAVLASFFLGLIALVGTCKLFAKADLPCWHVLIPFLNIMTVMKVIGRPTWHAFLFFTPAVVYLIPKIMIELAQCYGKNTTPSWWTFNIQASYKINDDLKAQLGVDNVCDLHYKPFASGISAPGRGVYVSLNANF